MDLEEGEDVIFVKPLKNKTERVLGFKVWTVTIVITNKRLVTIPQPPNKKNIQTESFYYKDISAAKRKAAMTCSGEDTNALFSINMKEKAVQDMKRIKKEITDFSVSKWKLPLLILLVH